MRSIRQNSDSPARTASCVTPFSFYTYHKKYHHSQLLDIQQNWPCIYKIYEFPLNTFSFLCCVNPNTSTISFLLFQKFRFCTTNVHTRFAFQFQDSKFCMTGNDSVDPWNRNRATSSAWLWVKRASSNLDTQALRRSLIWIQLEFRPTLASVGARTTPKAILTWQHSYLTYKTEKMFLSWATGFEGWVSRHWHNPKAIFTQDSWTWRKKETSTMAWWINTKNTNTGQKRHCVPVWSCYSSNMKRKIKSTHFFQGEQTLPVIGMWKIYNWPTAHQQRTENQSAEHLVQKIHDPLSLFLAVNYPARCEITDLVFRGAGFPDDIA